MSFQFCARKACEAAAVLLKAHPGERMEYLRLLKLLYIGERESWKLYGVPLLGGRLVAMNYGPLHSEVYDLVKGKPDQSQAWTRCIAKDGVSVHLVTNPGVAKLNDSEVQLLERVAREHEEETEWDIVEWTHSFSEWKAAFQPGTSATIQESDLLAAVGVSAEERAALIADRQEYESEIAALGGKR